MTSIIDGGITATMQPRTEQLKDYIDVTSSKLGFTRFTVTWSVGVTATLPPPSTDSIEVAHVFVDGDEFAVALPPNTTSFPVRLKNVHGPKSVHVTLKGGSRPSLSVSGMPSGTSEVQYISAGDQGVAVLGIAEDCSRDAVPQQAHFKGRFSDDGHAFWGDVPGTFVACKGQTRAVKTP